MIELSHAKSPPSPADASTVPRGPCSRQLEGVDSVVSGYSGGTVANPSYREVCGGRTGHAEVVHITFDPERIAVPRAARVLLRVHRSTATLNRQGADVGTQYRSAIFTHSERQAATRARGRRSS